MEEEENHFSTEKVEKICKRLQLLLGQWVDTIPIISVVSASTLISQIHYYSTNLKTCSNQLEWSNHEIAFLLIQTVSQLWDKEDNVNAYIEPVNFANILRGNNERKKSTSKSKRMNSKEKKKDTLI